MNNEERLFRKFTAKGWEVLRSGWPDMLCYRVDATNRIHVVFVEAKNDYYELRDNQEAMLRLLEKIGLKCYVYVEAGDKVVHLHEYIRRSGGTALERKEKRERRNNRDKKTKELTNNCITVSPAFAQELKELMEYYEKKRSEKPKRRNEKPKKKNEQKSVEKKGDDYYQLSREAWLQDKKEKMQLRLEREIENLFGEKMRVLEKIVMKKYCRLQRQMFAIEGENRRL